MTDQNLPAVPAGSLPDEAAMKDWAEMLVARAQSEGVELTGDGGQSYPRYHLRGPQAATIQSLPR